MRWWPASRFQTSVLTFGLLILVIFRTFIVFDSLELSNFQESDSEETIQVESLDTKVDAFKTKFDTNQITIEELKTTVEANQVSQLFGKT
jgi:hypothetical protein